MIEAIDLVKCGLNLDAVIPLDAWNRPGEIRARYWGGIRRRRKIDAELRVDQTDVGRTQIRVDLWREEIVDLVPGPLTGCVSGSSPLMMS